MKIKDHVFRGGKACLYPVPQGDASEDFDLCGEPETRHRASVTDSPAPRAHFFIGGRSCLGCGLRFNVPSHYLAPSRVRRIGLR